MDWNSIGMMLDRHGFPAAVALILLYHVLINGRRQGDAMLSLVSKIETLIEAQHRLTDAANRLCDQIAHPWRRSS